MRLRAQFLVAFVLIAWVPLAVTAWLARREANTYAVDRAKQDLQMTARDLGRDLELEMTGVSRRLGRLMEVIRDDNALRLQIVGAAPQDAVLLDFAPRARDLSGLEFLLLLDERGVTLSSAHHRNAYETDRGPLLAWMQEHAAGGVILEPVPEGETWARVALQPVPLGGTTAYLIGGHWVHPDRVEQWGRGSQGVILTLGDTDVLASAPGFLPDRSDTTGLWTVPVATWPTWDRSREGEATVRMATSTAPLRELVQRFDRRIGTLFGLTALGALVLAWFLAGRLTSPVTRLSEAASSFDLEQRAERFDSKRQDELGELSRFLAAMARRLQARARSLAEVEGRAAVGDLARQLNHDIKNGIVPLRNVVRALEQAAEAGPEELAGAFGQRRKMVGSGLEYLEDLSKQVGKLAGPSAKGAVRLDPVLHAAGAVWDADTRMHVTVLAEAGDAEVPMTETALRRVVDNLVGNARQAMSGGSRGSVELRSWRDEQGVGFCVRDDGPGMAADLAERAFEEFVTGSGEGRGLGLAIVRRLVTETGGVVRLDSKTGDGTEVTVRWAKEAGT